MTPWLSDRIIEDTSHPNYIGSNGDHSGHGHGHGVGYCGGTGAGKGYGSSVISGTFERFHPIDFCGDVSNFEVKQP